MAMGSPSTLYPKKVDLTNCDKEPIHLLGKIQPHGFLLVCNSNNYTLERASENFFEAFNLNQDHIETYDIVSIFGKEEGEKLINHFQTNEVKPLEVRFNETLFITIIHYKENRIYIELESITDHDVLFTQYDLSEIISELSGAPTLDAMCNKAAHLIHKKLGYDRVMLYKFDEDWNGEVISESLNLQKKSWLGLHYPASDIPKQARALFLRQGVRIIKDVNATDVNICPRANVQLNPIDLSNCELRAVSPIHIEYLKNMKVGATLTAAIISNGSLWGLIACHHDSPKFINYYQRLSVKFLTEVFSTQLTLRASNEVLQRINDTAVKRSLLVNQMSDGWDIHQGLTASECTFLDVTEASSGAIYTDGVLTTKGDTPHQNDILQLVDWIYKNGNDTIYKTQNIGEHYEKAQDLLKKASGVLCLFLTKNSKNCLLWFKPEVIQTVKWGGNPNKAVHQVGERISPRKSFDLWKQEQKGRSLPWQDYEVASAKALIESISKIIISKYDEVKRLNEELQAAYKDLETFSYSVSHDLRAPLRGIDGFAQIIKEDYFDTLDDFGKSSVHRIIDAAEHMNKLIDDIISFSSLGKGGMTLGNFSMSDLVAEIIDFLQVGSGILKAKLTVDDNLKDFYGDRGMVFQLVLNLVENAVKYTKKEEQPVIEIGQLLDGLVTTYFVRDNGIGFNQEHSDRIFGLFNRLVKEREFKGSGIGLAIAHRIIEKHQGRIWVESEVGVGSTFYFKLPTLEKPLEV